jgi:hypothetical protein
MKYTKSVEVEVTDNELWEGTFGTSGEQWKWWTEVTFLGEADWDKIGQVRLSIDCEGTKATKVVGIEDVRAAFQKVLSEGRDVDPCTGRFGTSPTDWDACESDLVLQTMVLGSVVFG